MVTYVRSDHPHGVSKSEEIFIISTTWPNRTADLAGNIRHRSWADIEWVCWPANVDIQLKRRHITISRMKLDMNYLVASDFAKIKVLPHVCFL